MYIDAMGEIFKHNKKSRLCEKAVLFFVFYSLMMLCAQIASATPSVSIKRADASLRESNSSAVYSVKSSEAGTYKLYVRTATGKKITAYSKRIAANQTASLSWNGRASKTNEAKIASGDYVPSGLYSVEMRVATSMGTKKITREVRVYASYKSGLRLNTITSSGTPSTKAGAHVFAFPFKITKKNDVHVIIRSKVTGNIVAWNKYRDVTPSVLKTAYWDGQVDYDGSVKLPNGASAISGDVAPAGTYVVKVKVHGTSAIREFTVKPTPVEKITFSAPSTLLVGSNKKLSAVVAPRGARTTQVAWSVSDTSLATITSAGNLVANDNKKEGTVTVYAKSLTKPTIVAQKHVSIRTKSTLGISGFAVTKWCVYKASKSIFGTVSTNQKIHWVKLAIYNEDGAVEISKTVKKGDPRYPSYASTFNIKASMDAYIPFASLSPGKKKVVITANDTLCTRRLYGQYFWVIGPTRYTTFWKNRTSTWVYPLNVKNRSNTSAFGTYRDNGARAHAAIDLIEPAGTKVYAMADGVVERISVGTYYAGTGAVQIKHDDGAVMWYCEVKAVGDLKVGDKVKQNQHIATIQRNNYGSAMLHLEAYSGKATGSLYVAENMTYDNVTAVRFNRRRDLMYPMGVLDLPVPAKR